LPIDNVTDGIEKYEDKLKHLQEDQQLKETKGQFLAT